MRLLDLYCGAGGCSVGYARAGFEVVGVDLYPQPNYPYDFAQADALEYLANGADGFWDIQSFDAIHASPPCQAYSALGTLSANEHPDLIGPTRDMLEATGLPYVIENVPGAPLRKDYLLCGSMFGIGAVCADGQYRRLRRHRWFETNWPVGLQPPCDHHGQPIGVYGDGGGGQMTRGYKGNLAESREALDIGWMNRSEISQAIPPAYTELIGHQLAQYLAYPRTTEGAPS